MALSALEQELGDAVRRLAGEAEPFPGADGAVPAVARAQAGDTVAALNRTANGIELSVVLGDPAFPDSTPRPVRLGTTVLTPSSASRVARATGYGVSLYVNGRPWGPSDGLDTLSRNLLLELSRTPGGTALTDGSEGVLMASGSQPGEAPRLVALSRPGTPPPPALELRILLVLGLLLVFSVLAGWIQLARPPDAQTRPPGTASFLTLALVPTLTAVLFLVHLTRTFEEAAADSAVHDLTRGLATAQALGASASASGVRLISGFHATLVDGGEILASTFAGDATPIAALPSPPPSFSTSGTVETPEGPSFYLSLRQRGGPVVVVTTQLPAARLAAAQGAFTRVGLGLLLWLAVAATILLVRKKEADEEPAR
jgi:hypothetical protein